MQLIKLIKEMGAKEIKRDFVSRGAVIMLRALLPCIFVALYILFFGSMHEVYY